MPTIIDFLKPTKYKLIFLVEWAVFILIVAVRGELETPHQVLVAVYPLAFFYLIACTLVALSQRVQPIARSRKLLLSACGLAVLDQAVKVMVAARIPYQASIPIVKDWLHLAHERNYTGSWIASEFNLQDGSSLNLALWGLTIIILIFIILWNHYYITTHRKSLWTNVAFWGLFAGLLSWICDMSLRGYVLDYINLPGVVTADLKDILLTIGVAAFFVELLDNPEMSWRWSGWQKEKDEFLRFFTFILKALRQAAHTVKRLFTKSTRPE